MTVQEKNKEEISLLTKKLFASKLKEKHIALDTYPIEKIKAEIFEILLTAYSEIKDSKFKVQLSLPPAHISTDLCFPIFELSKILKVNPADIGGNIEKVFAVATLTYIERVTFVGGFINVSLNKQQIYTQVLESIKSCGDKYGQTNVNEGKVVVIDYSAPNIAKPIGIGHLRSTIIGQCLGNIYAMTGYTTVRDNHLGDWGTQFGALLCAFEKWGSEEDLKQDPITKLKDLYVRFHEEAKENPELMDKAREYFKRLEDGEASLIAMWEKFRELSIQEFSKIYRLLDINFDLYVGESYFIDKTKDIVKDALLKNIAKKDPENETVVVDSIPDIPSFLLQKQDGSSLYLTRDLATIKFREETFKPETILFVVGKEQELHFNQLFAVSKLLGYTRDTALKHISFGLILQDGKKMSTRKGSLVELQDVIDFAIAKSKEVIANKQQLFSPQEVEEITRIIGVSSVLYNDLKQSRTKNISFNWDAMFSTQSGSAIYLQYTYVRIISILGKLEQRSIIH